MINSSSKKEVVFFDIDGTLLRGNLQLAFLRFLRKRRTISLAQYVDTIFQYALYLIGFSSRLRPAFELALSGLNGKTSKELQILMKNFLESRKFVFYSEAISIIKEHKSAGRNVVLLTTINEPLAQALAKHICIPNSIGTPLEMHNGIYTGRLAGKIIFGQGKVVAANIYIQTNNLSWANTWAYADSVSDVPLLKKVAHPFAINPSRKMQTHIQHSICKVLLFT